MLGIGFSEHRQTEDDRVHECTPDHLLAADRAGKPPVVRYCVAPFVVFKGKNDLGCSKVFCYNGFMMSRTL
jgi:hypothetical protein